MTQRKVAVVTGGARGIGRGWACGVGLVPAEEARERLGPRLRPVEAHGRIGRGAPHTGRR